MEFTELSCECEQADQLRVYTLTIDLNTGDVLTLDDLVPGDRDALISLWWNRMVEEQSWSLFDSAPTAPRPEQIITTASVDSGGLHLGINGDDGVATRGPVSVFVSFDDLEGLVDPTIRTRAGSGAEVVLPGFEECGC